MTDRFSFALRRAALALTGFALLTSAANAQSNPDLIYLQDRVERLEAQMQIQGQGGGAPLGDATEAGLSLRIGQLEEQVRQLNGQVEQYANMVRQLQARLGMASGGAPSLQSDGLDMGSGDDMLIGSGDDLVLPDEGIGSQPQILGQVPGQPLDLSGALGQPLNDFGNASEFGQSGSGTLLAAAPPTGNPHDDYDTAYGYILRGEFDVAEASFRQFLESYPDNELAGNAQYWLGESLYARGRYRDAADAFLAGYVDHPENTKAPDNLFKLGLSLKELGQRDAACETLSEIGREYPNAPQAVRERAQSEMEKSGC